MKLQTGKQKEGFGLREVVDGEKENKEWWIG
jgi:hypothetical protein